MLGVGPMSQSCVEAVIELATERDSPIMLVASRRQIEAEEFGSGYVNDWSSEEFVRFVRERDPEGYVLICRDHGGPWQNSNEAAEKLPLEQAMQRAKRSFEVDIEAGFDLLHIDPSVDVHGPVDQQTIAERALELYVHCQQYARDLELGPMAYELGTEEQTGSGQDLQVLDEFLTMMTALCKNEGLPLPLFVVGQTSTKVVETRNSGTLDQAFRVPGALPAELEIPKVVALCQSHGVNLKAHNADYLSDEGISWFPRLGVHAANIAPEFGVGETRYILQVCERLGLSAERDEILEVAYQSRKWEKWMAPDTTATDYDRAVIAGHYVFSTPEFRETKQKIAMEMQSAGGDLDAEVRGHLKGLIARYADGFRLGR
jgi:hypothetical protein